MSYYMYELPSKISFEIPYDDGSGAEVAVHWDANRSEYAEIESPGERVSVPVEHIGFIVDALRDIQKIAHERGLDGHE